MGDRMVRPVFTEPQARALLRAAVFVDAGDTSEIFPTGHNRRAFDGALQELRTAAERADPNAVNIPRRLTPDRKIAARAIDALTQLSRASIAGLRVNDPGDGRRAGQSSQVPRRMLAALVEAIDEAYPGWLDATLDVVEEQQRAEQERLGLAPQPTAGEQ